MSRLQTSVTVLYNHGCTFANYKGNIVPQIQTGGGKGTNGGLDFMEIMTMKAAKDLNLDMKVSKN